MSDPKSPLVCYCFGHTAADILAAQEPDGGNAVIRDITAACRAGRDRCAELNPEGRCCLGNARALLRTARDDESPGCC